MNTLLYTVIQIAVILLIAPFLNGVIKKVKALTQKRKGAPLLQQYFDLYKLLKKRSVVSETASWIFRVTPFIVFATALSASLFVPVTTVISAASFPGDVIMLFSVLALGRFFMVISALDTGSTFGGMGGSREAMISALIEPSILVTFLTLGLYANSTSVSAIMKAAGAAGIPLLNPMFILSFLAMLIIIISETSRIPVDDPSTHLELTMVHEAMLLEYSGRGLALMEYGASIKQLVLITLLVNVFVPVDQLLSVTGAAAVVVSLLIYLVKVTLASVLTGIIESFTVKIRFFSVPNLAALAFILSFVGFLQFFVFGR
jgi:formate hydrogenlyase subunit 4